MQQVDREYATGLARAFGGALLFALPLLMTMEMWWLGGFAMDRTRLLLFLLLSLPMLLGLSFYAGFEPTFRLEDEILDALAAFGVGVVLACAALSVTGVLGPELSLGESAGAIAICTVPGAIGALLAGKQFTSGASVTDRSKPQIGYAGTLFLMSVGAVFLAFNVAPTEEVALISYQMGAWHALALIAASLILLHLIVFMLGFPGEERRKGEAGFLRSFFIHTIPGYGIALAISLYCLWTFGRLDQVAAHEVATMTVVLAFPAAVGAATARLVI